MCVPPYGRYVRGVVADCLPGDRANSPRTLNTHLPVPLDGLIWQSHWKLPVDAAYLAAIDRDMDRARPGRNSPVRRSGTKESKTTWWKRRRWAGVRCWRSVVKRGVSKVGTVVSFGQHDEARGGCRGLRGVSLGLEGFGDVVRAERLWPSCGGAVHGCALLDGRVVCCLASFISRSSTCRRVPEVVGDQQARECRAEMTAVTWPSVAAEARAFLVETSGSPPVRMEPDLVTDERLGGVLDELVRGEPLFHRPEVGTTRADLEAMTAPDLSWPVGAGAGSSHPV